MKYVKCPRCGLNYILTDEDMCQVCKYELNRKKSIFDDSDYNELICPYCDKHILGLDEIMCSECRARRNKNKT